MNEKILTSLVIVSLVLSVFNLVLLLKTNSTNTVTDVVGQSSTSKLYMSNMTKMPQGTIGFAYVPTITNPTNEAIPCVISMKLDNGTYSETFVLSEDVYQSISWIFVIPPQMSVGLYNPDFRLGVSSNINYTTATTTIFSLLNGETTQQTLAIQQPSYTSPTGQAGVILYEANVNFYSNGTKIDIDIGNSGTSDTTIIQVYIGTSSSAMDNQTIIPVPLQAGSVQRITVDYSWQYGVTYYFTVLTSTGQSLPWTEQAPVA